MFHFNCISFELIYNLLFGVKVYFFSLKDFLFYIFLFWPPDRALRASFLKCLLFLPNNTRSLSYLWHHAYGWYNIAKFSVFWKSFPSIRINLLSKEK